MGRTGRRIARIKLTPFIEALERSVPGLELPERVPATICCLLPHHDDSSPSFLLQEHRWHCFGCSVGGDVVDFVQEYHDCDLFEAIALVEHGLGYSVEGDDAELLALVALARGGDSSGAPTQVEWEREVAAIEATFFDQVRPYLRCRDWMVADPAWSWSGYVFAELDAEGMRPAPRTERGMRDTLRTLRRWAGDHGRGVAGDALRVTGKDRLDVATQRGTI